MVDVLCVRFYEDLELRYLRKKQKRTFAQANFIQWVGNKGFREIKKLRTPLHHR